MRVNNKLKWYEAGRTPMDYSAYIWKRGFRNYELHVTVFSPDNEDIEMVDVNVLNIKSVKVAISMIDNEVDNLYRAYEKYE